MQWQTERKMKTKVSALVLLLLNFSAFADTTHPAEAVVKETTDKVVTALKQQQDDRQVTTLINEIIIPHFDFTKMAQWTLGNEWEKLDVQKRELFVSNFQQLLINTYATALIKFENQSIDILEVKTGKNPNIVAVPTRINLANDNPVMISYMMMNGDNGWKVIDMSISGISIVKNYRATYASEIRSNGFDELMRKLIEKNDLAQR